MDINEFIDKFAEIFDDTDRNEFHANTKFKELDEWSSIMALNVIAMVDDEYDVLLKGDDIRGTETISQLFDIVKSRK